MAVPGEISSITLPPDQAARLTARLEALARTARIFGSGIADADVRVTWSLEPGSEEIRWSTTADGRPLVLVRLDLNHVIDLLHEPEQAGETSYVTAFKAGFLHELGHILYSPGPIGCDLRDAEHTDELAAALSPRHRDQLRSASVRKLLELVHHTLEDARIDGHLNRDFRGAPRYLKAHADRARALIEGKPAPDHEAEFGKAGFESEATRAITQLVAILFLDLFGHGEQWDRSSVRPDILAAAERLSKSLDEHKLRDTETCLSQWVVEAVLPELDGLIDLEPLLEPAASPPAKAGGEAAGEPEQEERGETEQGPKTEAAVSEQGRKEESQVEEAAPQTSDQPLLSDPLEQAAERIASELRAPGLFSSIERPERVAVQGAHEDEARQTELISYPHVSGGFVVDEITVVRAKAIPPTDRVRNVMNDVVRIYGPRALDAFAAEAKALRRAFQVNYERRYAGRYRTGRHIGIRNLRRYVVQNDLRVFQRITVPDRLSYYFHILLDVSPSMLTNKNLQKALAVGYAFTEALDRLRVPVDVSLYSSAVTELYDHRHDVLDRYFGASFGYLSSGTHEIEAIAFARERMRRIPEERKILVVITDGQPNGLALARAGAQDLRSYYREYLVPWLKQAGIDLIAIGIGTAPSYHPAAATISSGWESVGIFMRLLDEIIARADQSHAALWR